MTPRTASIGVVLWTALLAASALWLRPFADGLRARGLLSEVVAGSLVVAGWLVFRLLRREGPDEALVPWVPLVLTGVAYVALAGWWRLPEERIHLAQYAPLGVLAWRACGRRSVAALALAAAIGVGDELLQGTLADRQFDPWDVVGNTVASAAAVLLARGGRGAWGAVALLVAARLVLPVVHPGHPGIGDGADGSAPTPLAAADEPALDYAGAPILLVTVDALRADFVAPWGASPVPTPVFSRLARESVSFDEVFANSIWTTPSMVSFLVGLGPAVHGVQERGRELAPSIETPLEALVEAGWRTLGYAGDETETYRNLGFQSELDRDGDMLAEVVSALASPTPTFVWLHLRDVHAPYDATPDRLAELGLPAELPVSPILDRARTGYTVPRADFPGHHGWLKGPIRALYAKEVVDADTRLGDLLDRLEAAGLSRRAIVVVSADHGEELLDHDGIGHASTTLDSVPQPELVRIPLWIRLPDGHGAGVRVGGRFEQVDLMPTLLSLVGVPMPELAPGVAADGRDLSRLLRAPGTSSIPPRPTLISSSPCGWQCPADRRGERVHAWVDGDRWTWCREGVGSCPEPLLAPLRAARERQRSVP